MSETVFPVALLGGAFNAIRAAETALQARAKAAGLDCMVFLHGYGDRQNQRVGIKLKTWNSSFPQPGKRAVMWANAYSLEEFDATVAGAVEYLKGRAAKK